MSKLKVGYPSGDKIALQFNNSWQKDIDPIFAKRLSAAGIIEISSGYRSFDEQLKLVDEAVLNNVGYFKYLGGAYNGRGQCMVAPAGSSWHNYKVAVDVGGSALYLDNAYLFNYGLYKPMEYEPWHIQPIETSWDFDKLSYLEACSEVMEVIEVKEIITLKQALEVFVAKGADIDIKHWEEAGDYIVWFKELMIKLAKVV